VDDPDVPCFSVLVEAREVAGHTARTGFSAPTGLAYSVPRKNNLPQFVVLGIVTVLYWFVLSLIQNFDRPFTGMLALEPTSMQKTAWDIGQDYATTYNSEPPCNGRGQPR
jgi:hypothetical protein